MSRTTCARISIYLAALGCAYFAFAAFWGIAGPFGSGHYAMKFSTGMGAESMLKWHVGAPITLYSADPPKDFFCDHPFGVYWLPVPFIYLFGHTFFGLNIGPALMSVGTAILIYQTARAAWGDIPGLAALVGFVTLPITVGYADANLLECFVAFGWSLFFWGHCKMMKEGKTRYLLASLLGVLFVAASEWFGYLGLAAFLAWAFVRAFVIPEKWSPRFSYKLYSKWWAYAVTLAVGSLIAWIAIFSKLDKLVTWINMGSWRSNGPAAPLGVLLKSREHWIDLMFTPLAIGVGKIALPIALVRLLWTRRDVEAYSICALFAAGVEYVVFRQAASIHIFWPHPFSTYFAFAFAQLIATVMMGATWGWRKIGGARLHGVGEWTGLALVVIFGVMMLPDSARALRYARESGGAFNAQGFTTHVEDILALQHISARVAHDRTIAFQPRSVPHWQWEYVWAVGIPVRPEDRLPTTHTAPGERESLYVVRPSDLSPMQMRNLVSTFHVEAYGDLWIIDRSALHASIDAFSFDEREPTWWEWLVFGGYEPHRTLAPDPWVTWEWRSHLDQPAPIPTTPPVTFNQRRIAYNLAIFQGDRARAEQLRRGLEAELDRTSAINVPNGVALLGVRVLRGSRQRLEALLQAPGPLPGAVFRVRSRVVAQLPLSLVPIDPSIREAANMRAMSPALWRSGELYETAIPLVHRIGVERYEGVWDTNRAPVQLAILK